MFIIDLTNPLTLVLLLIATVLLIFLGKEIKKPHAPAAALISTAQKSESSAGNM